MRDIFKKLLLEYTNNLKVRNYNSQKMYTSAVKEFFEFHEQRGKHTTDFNQADMIAYYEYLITRNNKRRSGTLAQSTINHYLFAVRLLFDYMLTAEYAEALPVVPKYLRGQQSEMEILTVEQIKELYQACTKRIRNSRFIHSLWRRTQKNRNHELNITDVLLRDSTLIVQKGKNSKRREVPLSDKVVKDLKDYLHNYRTLKSKDQKSVLCQSTRNTNEWKHTQQNSEANCSKNWNENRNLIAHTSKKYCNTFGRKRSRDLFHSRVLGSQLD